MLDVKKLLTKMLKNMPEIRHGTATNLGTAAANTYTDKAITFDEPMNGVPTVVCQFYSTATAGGMGGLTVSAINPTKNGFTARIFNNTSSGRAPAIEWVAFYGGGTS